MWAFAPNFDAERRRMLERLATFDDVIRAIRDRCQVTGAWLDEGIELGPPTCWRPTVALELPPEVFDAFFNAPAGYRAQYLASPEEGQSANGRILRTLEPTLTAAVIQHCGETRMDRV